MEYAWKEGVRFKTDPNVAGTVLAGIRDKFGELTPELVLKEASKKSSSLHSDFQWDDKRAATLYRLDTARRLIRHLRVVSDGERTDEPVYVHVTQGDRKYYEQTDLALESPDIWKNVMVEEKARLESINKRLKTLINIENNGSRIDITKSVISGIESGLEPMQQI
jgi:hypothetical protein